jgi:hypothetical protein
VLEQSKVELEAGLKDSEPVAAARVAGAPPGVPMR